MIFRAQKFLPLPTRHVVAQQEGSIATLTIANQIKHAIMHHLYTTAAVRSLVISSKRVVLIEQPATLQVVALQQAIVVEQKELFFVEHGKFLQAHPFRQPDLLTIFGREYIMALTQPKVAVAINEHIVDAILGSV